MQNPRKHLVFQDIPVPYLVKLLKDNNRYKFK